MRVLQHPACPACRHADTGGGRCATNRERRQKTEASRSELGNPSTPALLDVKPFPSVFCLLTFVFFSESPMTRFGCHSHPPPKCTRTTARTRTGARAAGLDLEVHRAVRENRRRSGLRHGQPCCTCSAPSTVRDHGSVPNWRPSAHRQPAEANAGTSSCNQTFGFISSSTNCARSHKPSERASPTDDRHSLFRC